MQCGMQRASSDEESVWHLSCVERSCDPIAINVRSDMANTCENMRTLLEMAHVTLQGSIYRW